MEKVREVKIRTLPDNQMTRFETSQGEHILVSTSWNGYLYETAIYVTDIQGKILKFQPLELYVHTVYDEALACHKLVGGNWYYGTLQTKDFLKRG